MSRLLGKHGTRALRNNQWRIGRVSDENFVEKKQGEKLGASKIMNDSKGRVWKKIVCFYTLTLLFSLFFGTMWSAEQGSSK